MSAYPIETDNKIRDLGKSLKLQLDFLAAADITQRDDQLKNIEMNAKTATLMVQVMRDLQITAQNDADALDKIVQAARNNGSDAAEAIAPLVDKVRGINEDVAALAKQKHANNENVSGNDINRIFRKHLGR